MKIKTYIVNRSESNATSPDYILRDTPDRDQAVSTAVNYAAVHNEPIDVTAIYHDHTPRTVRFFPNGEAERIWETVERELTIYKVLQDSDIVQDWPGFTYSGELLEVTRDGGESITYRVVTGPYTPSGACRDCGSHYVIAGYSSYRSINKKDLSVKYYVKDQ